MDKRNECSDSGIDLPVSAVSMETERALLGEKLEEKECSWAPIMEYVADGRGVLASLFPFFSQFHCNVLHFL